MVSTAASVGRSARGDPRGAQTRRHRQRRGYARRGWLQLHSASSARCRAKRGRIPAIALTAYARAEDRKRALVAGFQNHAAKPIEPQELVIVIANLAGRYS